MSDAKRREKRLENIIVVTAFIIITVLVVAIRAYIVGGFNECFWATDVGLCLTVQELGP